MLRRHASASFPDIRWIIGHLGGAIPYLMERLDNGFRDFAECRVEDRQLPSIYLKQLYYDTVTFSPHTLNMVRDLVGADHMVMGSDYPHLLGSIDRAVSSIEALDIPAAREAADLQRHRALDPEQRRVGHVRA